MAKPACVHRWYRRPTPDNQNYVAGLWVGPGGRHTVVHLTIDVNGTLLNQTFHSVSINNCCALFILFLDVGEIVFQLLGLIVVATIIQHGSREREGGERERDQARKNERGRLNIDLENSQMIAIIERALNHQFIHLSNMNTFTAKLCGEIAFKS